MSWVYVVRATPVDVVCSIVVVSSRMLGFEIKKPVACLATAVLCDSVVSADEGLLAADTAES